MSTDHRDHLLTISEAAARLSISVRGLWRLIAASRLPAPVKIGRSARLYASDISRFLEELKPQRSNPL
jgi:excisionase family DNA binding protein